MSTLKLIYHDDKGRAIHYKVEWKDGTGTLENIEKDGQRAVSTLVEQIRFEQWVRETTGR